MIVIFNKKNFKSTSLENNLGILIQSVLFKIMQLKAINSRFFKFLR